MLFFSSCNFCGNFWGSQDLGNNLTLFSRDNVKGHYDIIYCSNYKNGCCSGGPYVIPSEGYQYYMYVEKAKSNDKWIIASTIPIMANIEFAISNKNEDLVKTIPKKKSYWIISKDFDIEKLNCDKVNCDSIIQMNVIGPLDIENFNGKILELKIDLKN